VAAFGIVLLFRYPVRTALLISASLAQIGEFSFILAGLGVSLGLIPEASRSLVLAGAIISITMNPVLFGLVDPIDRWLRARPRLLDALERDREVSVVTNQAPVSVRDHAIIIGYGRVGGTIGETLSRNGVPYAVIERDRVMVESLRKRGVQSVFGDAARAGLLEQVHVDTARILIVTAPEPYHARRIVELARQINPDIVTVVRTHSDAERLYLERLGVGRAVMGERELAFGIAHFALVSLGRTDDEADVIIDGVRRSQSARGAESGTAA
jgi:CPA2 family monovalent cation:H+ antiporter-2